MQDVMSQLVKLGDEIQQLRLDNATLQGQVAALQSSQGVGGKGSGQKSVLRDFKKLYPEKFNPKSDSFVAWSEDFIRWIRAESTELAGALEKSAEREVEIPMVDGSHSAWKPDIQFAWLHLKRLMGDRESSDIVRTTPDDNALESFRLPTTRYAPNNNKVRSKRLRAIPSSRWTRSSPSSPALSSRPST